MSEVLVAGGGIGGLTAALCLARRGFPVRLFEQASTFDEPGAAVQLGPNATRVLHHLDLESRLRSSAFLPETIEIREWRSGRVLATYPLGEHMRETYGFPYCIFLRSDLVTCLANAACEDSRIKLHTGARVDGIHQGPTSVSVSTDGKRYTGSILAGADGIHSTVRTALFGSEEPRYSHHIAWRTLVPATGLPEDLLRPVVTVWWGPGKHFVHYLAGDNSLVNCVGVTRTDEPEPASWIETGECAEFRDDFAGWHRDIQALIDRTESAGCHKWALFDRPPMPHWTNHRVTLLGDACHPALPFMAQGAAMAIEDAAVLTHCIANEPDIPSALGRYETLRVGRTSEVQRRSRRNARIFHLSGLSAWTRNRAARFVGGRIFRRLFDYNAVAAARK